MNISDILRHKGSRVLTISPDDTVIDLLRALSENNVGALLVRTGDDVLGIVSERDVVRRIAERGASVLAGTVGEIMTTDVLSCTSRDSVDSVGQTMTARRIRHMPVVDDGALVGIISIGDVVLSRIRQLEIDRGQLEQYISS